MAKKKTKKSIASTKKTAPVRVKDFQSMISDLQQFWSDWGCVVWQPYNEKVGAGTMNPATFLRVLGPEPWNVAYVEPSVRPDDGRYGENPNRMQQHYQYQVILKPDPGNPQEIYLKSLAAIGIDLNKHDIRFVEDNWASPALGAWGLGWEVWLDGLEITQFTYFQQAGGIALDPVSVEITYGLDRIAMALNGVQFVGDLKWSQNRSWGDLNLQGEREHSKYYFEVADTARLRQMVELYEAEAKASLEAGLLLPAYDYVLKTSHGFNVLDARGAIGVTERQAYFRRMRAFSGQVAQAYVADRLRQEYPWMDTVGEGLRPSRPSAKQKVLVPKQSADFLLEIGTEELPPSDLESALEQLHLAIENLLAEERLDHDEIKVMGTPRRLVAFVSTLASRQADRERVVKGPPAARAFGADGTPTPAAEGFARGQEIPVSALKVEEVDGGKYAIAYIQQKGRSAIAVLSESLPGLIASMRFEQSMRWNASGVAFSRPVRWLLALHGKQVVPFEFAGLQSAPTSRGLRLGKPESFKVESPKDYFAQLKKQGILLDDTARRAAIEKQIQSLAAKAGGAIPEDDDLLNEVTNLVESPAALLGEFEASFLDLPREVLIAVMKKHQRYFPIEKNGKLLNKFIVVGNGSFEPKAVTAGNADVIRARFTDAAYFVRRDREHPLESYLEKLKSLTFQKDLGSMWDKTQRIVALTKELSSKLNLSADESNIAQRAAQLSKADLATKMVVEMTSLQGVMGKYYALDSGEPPAVADAIFEHYLPRYTGDEIARTRAGIILAIADRLDTLTGLFTTGIKVSGSADPFGLRRAAIGIIINIKSLGINFDLVWALRIAFRLQPIVSDENIVDQANSYILERLRGMYVHYHRPDVVDAVIAEQAVNLNQLEDAILALGKKVRGRDWRPTLEAFSRCVRITRDLHETYSVDESAIVEGAERELLNALVAAEATQRSPGSVDDFLNVFAPMIPVINLFFDKVLVMAEDEKIKRNRLGLLQRVAMLADGVADFSKLEGF
jgi:glycyl-tRNA synthetase